MRHGYSYRFIEAPDLDDRHPTWYKVPYLYATLKEFHFVVLLDADAYVTQPEVPLHLLMHRWGFKRGSSLLMAIDPESDEANIDSHGNTNLNTGFILAQRTPLALEILGDWKDCLSRIPECEEWRQVRLQPTLTRHTLAEAGP